MSKEVNINELELLNAQFKQAIEQAFKTNDPQDILFAKRLKNNLRKKITKTKRNLGKFFTPEQKQFLAKELHCSFYNLSGKAFRQLRENPPPGLDVIFSSEIRSQFKRLDAITSLNTKVAVSDMNLNSFWPNFDLRDQLDLLKVQNKLISQFSPQIEAYWGRPADYLELFYQLFLNNQIPFSRYTRFRVNFNYDHNHTYMIELAKRPIIAFDFIPYQYRSSDLDLLPLFIPK